MISATELTSFDAILYATQSGLAAGLGVTIIDLDGNPVSPRYTGVVATSTPNIYRISLVAPPAPSGDRSLLLVWDGAGVDAVEELVVEPTPTSMVAYLPPVKMVANYVRARTKADAGEMGTFTLSTVPLNQQTRPSAEQVEELIQQAGDDVLTEVGGTVPVAVQGAAQSLVALGAALLVELTYFPEQVNSGRSAYSQLKDLYDSRLIRLVTAVQESEDPLGDGDPDAGSGVGGYPSFGGFPATAIGMENPW